MNMYIDCLRMMYWVARWEDITYFDNANVATVLAFRSQTKSVHTQQVDKAGSLDNKM